MMDDSDVGQLIAMILLAALINVSNHCVSFHCRGGTQYSETLNREPAAALKLQTLIENMDISVNPAEITQVVRNVDDYLYDNSHILMASYALNPRMVGIHTYKELVLNFMTESSYSPTSTVLLNYVIERVCSNDPGHIFLRTLDLVKYSNCSENIKTLYHLPLNFATRLDLKCPEILKDKIKIKFGNEPMSHAQLEAMSHVYGEKARMKVLKQIKKMSKRIPFVRETHDLDSYGIKSHRMVIILGISVISQYKALFNRPIPYGFIPGLACTPLGSALMFLDMNWVHRLEKSAMNNKFFRFWNSIGTSLFLR